MTTNDHAKTPKSGVQRGRDMFAAETNPQNLDAQKSPDSGVQRGKDLFAAELRTKEEK